MKPTILRYERQGAGASSALFRTVRSDMCPYRSEIVVSLCLTAATLITFGNAIANDFVDFDDSDYVVLNSDLNKGLTSQGLAWAFTSFRAGNWHPLTWLSLLLDRQLYGLSPWGYHFTNVLLHAANAVLLFCAFRLLTGRLWASAALAAFFALHPLRVESVAWVAERKDVLSSFFGILSLLAYAFYVRRPGFLRYSAVILLFILSLMSKPMLVTLPFVLLLLDWWPLRRGTREEGRGTLITFSIFHFVSNGEWEMENVKTSPRPSSLAPGPSRLPALLLEKVPLLALAFASCLVTWHAQTGGGAVASFERFPLPTRIASAIVSYVQYIRMTLWPAGLAVYYPHPGSSLSTLQIALALALLTAISLAVTLLVHRAPYLTVGWLWFMGMLVPVIGIVQVGDQGLADRYTYLPSIGLTLMLVWGSMDLGCRWGLERFLAPCAAVCLLALGTLTWRDVRYWRNTGELWQHALAVTGENDHVHVGMGGYYWKLQKWAEAEREYNAVLQLRPTPVAAAIAHSNLGVLLYQDGRVEDAQRHFAAAVQLRPGDVSSRLNLGSCFISMNQSSAALEQYQKALETDSENPTAHAALGGLLYGLGRLDEAESHFRAALHAAPDDEACHSNLGVVLLDLSRPSEAIEHLETAQRLNPERVETYPLLASALADRGRFDEAFDSLRRVIKLKPDSAVLHVALANTLARHGDVIEAEREYRAALRLPLGPSAVAGDAWLLATHGDPHRRNGKLALELAQLLNQGPGKDNVVILDILAAAFAEQGQYDEALIVARRARELAALKRPELTEPVETRLRMYENHQPFHQDPKVRKAAVPGTPQVSANR